MVRYEGSSFKLGSRYNPVDYLGTIEDMIVDLSVVRGFVESGDITGALKQTTQIVHYKTGYFFSYNGTDDRTGERVQVSYINYRDPIVNQDHVKDNGNHRGIITGSAEWSFQLAIYMVQVNSLNLNRRNIFPGLPPEDPRYMMIQE